MTGAQPTNSNSYYAFWFCFEQVSRSKLMEIYIYFWYLIFHTLFLI